MSNHAIIVAGGRGKRMAAGRNKCFLPLAGREMITWTIRAFVDSGVTDSITCVVADEGEVAGLKEILDKNGMAGAIQKIVPTGGEERQDGVWTGVGALKDLSPGPDDVIIIHNGANPLIKAAEIQKSINAAKEFGASVCAVRVKDTIKRVDEVLFVVETLDRRELWAMQTPQAIKYSVAVGAFKKAFADNFYGTDDVQLVERVGGRVKIIECSHENFKITTPQDLDLAERIIKVSGY